MFPGPPGSILGPKGITFRPFMSGIPGTDTGVTIVLWSEFKLGFVKKKEHRIK